MTQTIEQLPARIAELEEENARLSDGVVCGDCDGSGWLENRVEGRYPCTCMTEAEPYQLLAEQLAAEQLNNKLLREALNQWIGIAANCSIESGCCGCGESIENHSHPMMCGHSPVDMADSVVREAIDSTDKALSTPASTEALDKYVAEKVKEATATQKEYYEGVFQDGSKQIAKAFRQRDLAVEALEKWDMFFGGDAETAVLTIAEDPSTLTGCQKATKEAMSAIKECEAK